MNASSLEKKAERQFTLDAKGLEPMVDRSLNMLFHNSVSHGKLRAQVDHLESWLKIEKARIITEHFHDLSAAAAESRALCHKDYIKAVDALNTAREEWYKAQFGREAASAFIEAWRTACSNERKGTL